MVAIVLLPGMDGTGALFSDFVSALEDKINPIVVSYPKNRPLGYAQLAEYALTHLPTDQPYLLLGESFSGPVAISIAARKPAGLIGLILCCSFASNPRPYLKPFKRLVRLLPLNRKYADHLMPFLLGRYSTATLRQAVRHALDEITPGVLKKRMEEVLLVDFRESLKKIAVPVLYLQASEDRVVPRAALRQFENQMSVFQSIRLPAPHMLLQAAPKEAATMVKKYIEGTVATFNAAANPDPPATSRLP